MNKSLNSDIFQVAEKLLQEYFSSKIQIISYSFLSAPEQQSVVLRIILDSDLSLVPKSVILKFFPQKEQDEDIFAKFSRNWAALEFVNQISSILVNVPRFYGGNKKHLFILMEDLGEQHISLINTLTFSNRDNAIHALQRFMQTLGRFHAACFNHTQGYEAILKKVYPNAKTKKEELEFTFSELLPKLEAANQSLNLLLSNACIKEARSVIQNMLMPGPFSVLVHGDICPDNVFDDEDNQELQLIDFEWARIRNALLDGTYLRMSMPTCWCAKALPNEVINNLEFTYREELKRTMPAARNNLAFTNAYTEACGFWILCRTVPFLDYILKADRVAPSGPVPPNSLWKDEENYIRPRFLSRLQAFVDVSTSNNLLPNLRKMATNMLIEVKRHWIDAKFLELYPAFRSKNHN